MQIIPYVHSVPESAMGAAEIANEKGCLNIMLIDVVYFLMVG